MSEEHPPAPPSTKEDTPPSTPTTKLVSYSSLDELVTSEKTVKDPTEIAMPVNCEIEPLGFLFKTPRKVFHNGKEKFSSPIHRFAGVLRRKLSGDVVWSERLFHMVRPRTCPRLLRYALKCLEESDSGCTSQYFESPSESLRLPRRWSLTGGGSSSSKLPKSYSACVLYSYYVCFIELLTSYSSSSSSSPTSPSIFDCASQFSSWKHEAEILTLFSTERT